MIVILGAGVIGLSTAYYIKKQSPDTEILIIADEFPRDGEFSTSYTTSKSGAHFRPFPSKDSNEFRDSKYTKDTYNFFKVLAKEHPETSIKFIKGFDYIEYNNPLYEGLGKGYLGAVEDFKVLKKEQLPKSVEFGAEYTTWCVNPHKYVSFLYDYLVMHGVNFEKRYVDSIDAIVSEVASENTIVNAMGIGLDDSASFKIRGQTLLVKPPIGVLEDFENKTITYQMANGEWCFVIPRPLNGGIILGGTKDVNNTNTEIDEGEMSTLVENARVRFPELFNKDGELDVLRVNVGFRPARKGGVRLEKVGNVVHAYGFGGSGIEMSWGAAIKAGALALRSGKL